MSLITTRRTYAHVSGDTAQFTALDGVTETLTADETGDIRQAVIRRATEEAASTGSRVELITTGDRGDHHLVVAGDGAVDAASTLGTEYQIAADGDGAEELMPETPRRRDARADTATLDPPGRTSFIEGQSSGGGPQSWWQRTLVRLGIGPSPVQVRRRQDEHAVSRHWAGCRTIAVVNGKGGVGKTMTTAMLAAVFARHGGGNVLAWDNNDTRGTLGWRTEQGTYDTTIKDLLPSARELLAAGAGVSDIARFVHHQSEDRYDVLRSNPELLAAHQRIQTTEFDLLMQVAARYYRIVIFDSGNDESAERWLRMIDSSYQLVIPTLATPESAESAALLLDALRDRDDRSRQLADNAVVVVTEAEPDAREANRISDGFAGQVRAVTRIPFDRALKSGPLRYDQIRPATRDAWLRATAAVADGL